jgi:Fur family ferric uptake transcriptional regulator
VCASCGAVQQQPTDIALGLAGAARATLGFTVDLRHLVLHGWCADCRAGSARGSAALPEA